MIVVEVVALRLLLTGVLVGEPLQGCVYTNRMINVGVLNNKLYFRAINLVRQFAGATFDTGWLMSPIGCCPANGTVTAPACPSPRCCAARDCLLKVIHDVDELTDEIRGFTITKHIQVGA